MEDKKTTTDEVSHSEASSQSPEAAAPGTPEGTPTEPSAAGHAAPAEQSEQSSSKQGGKIALAIVFLLIVGGLVWAGMQQRDNSAVVSGDDINFDSNAPAPDFDDVPDVVATVNGTELNKADYVQAYNQAQQTVQQQGVPANEAAVQTQALDVLINTELLVQAANDAGVTVSEEAVDAELASFTEQFGGEEGLTTALADAGIDQETLTASVREQLLVENYLATTPELSEEVAITDEAIQARYDEVAAQGVEGLPSLEEVAPQIEAQLAAEAEQTATQSLIERLRAAADISTFVDGE